MSGPPSGSAALLIKALREPKKAISYSACYLIYAIKRLWVRDYIVVRPERPDRPHLLWKLAMLSGYEMVDEGTAARRAPRRPPLAGVYHSDTTKEAFHEPDLVNGTCSDISKMHVDQVFQPVFGYSIMIDPTRHAGAAVRKSNENAKHDGRIIQCPIDSKELDDHYVYQKLIDNTVDSLHTRDLRVMVVGGIALGVIDKHRKIDCRFRGQLCT